MKLMYIAQAQEKTWETLTSLPVKKKYNAPELIGIRRIYLPEESPKSLADFAAWSKFWASMFRRLVIRRIRAEK